MPVIRPTGRGEPLATVRDHLADLLVKELLGERTRLGPVVFELPTEQQDSVDVIVVWEAWKSLPVNARSAVVRDAYSRFKKTLEASVPSIDHEKPRGALAPVPASVIAVTWEDLAQTDILPYQIEPMARKNEADPEDIRLLMMDSGAIQTPFGIQLRFPTKEMAADVHARLMEEMPEAHWSLVETIGPIMG